jgi:large subunit ribosomal protein L23
MTPEQVIKRPLFMTEKGTRLQEGFNQYSFEVDQRANKIDVRTAVEVLFNVSVSNVNTLIVRGHPRRMGRMMGKTRNWKKAIVTLKSGEEIDFFGGS